MVKYEYDVLYMYGVDRCDRRYRVEATEGMLVYWIGWSAVSGGDAEQEK